MKSYFFPVVVIALATIILLQRCGVNTPTPGKPIIDTLVLTKTIEKHDTVHSKPILIESEPRIRWRDSIVYIPDTNYQKLYDQYVKLADKYFALSRFIDTLRIDTMGYVVVNDTVTTNTITGRAYMYSLKYKEIERIITIKEAYKPVNQLYLGGGLDGSKTDLIKSINFGVLFKNKKDQIFGAKAGIGVDGSPFFGVQGYWKLSFK